MNIPSNLKAFEKHETYQVEMAINDNMKQTVFERESEILKIEVLKDGEKDMLQVSIDHICCSIQGRIRFILHDPMSSK